MTIDVRNEDVVTLTDAARLKLWPKRRGGKRPHVGTLYRWSTAGCRGVTLETVQVGATRCTSVEAIGRFLERLTAASPTGATATAQPSRSARKRHAAAEKALDAAGI